MRVESEDDVAGELARAVVRRLPAAESGVELGGPAGAEMGDLLGGDGRNLASAAGVRWVGLEGEEGGRRGRGRKAERGGEGFVVEMVADEEGLQVGGVGVRRQGGEVEMAKVH